MAAARGADDHLSCGNRLVHRETVMKIFSAVVLSGVVLTAVVAGVSGYSWRSRATAGFDTNAVSAVRGLGPVVYRAEHCAGDYVCDEHGAWAAVHAGP
jgi:hypothetical protein